MAKIDTTNMFLVGTYTLEDVTNGKDKEDTENFEKLNPNFKYFYPVITKIKGQEVMKVYAYHQYV